MIMMVNHIQFNWSCQTAVTRQKNERNCYSLTQFPAGSFPFLCSDILVRRHVSIVA